MAQRSHSAGGTNTLWLDHVLRCKREGGESGGGGNMMVFEE